MSSRYLAEQILGKNCSGGPRKSRFDISASAIGFDLNTRLLRPGLVESTCRAHMRSE